MALQQDERYTATAQLYRIRPGTGRDRVHAGGGDDRILARDGDRDHVDCARGRDVVRADSDDDVGSDCELVLRR